MPPSIPIPHENRIYFQSCCIINNNGKSLCKIPTEELKIGYRWKIGFYYDKDKPGRIGYGYCQVKNK